MATEFARLERNGLQHLEYLGGRGVLEAPAVDRRASSSNKYPVILWIHGGAFVTGSAFTSVNLPGAVRNFISNGIVVVSIQYRLGMLGFFTTKTDDFPPNRGLLDQVEAMKFVREEIDNFGGDPNKITIAGESAGSVSVSAHTYSPLSQNLFQQAIMESGAVWTCIDDSTVVKFTAVTFAAQN
uniref:Carboxylic ester hydrolase n=1 Tax=Acrobeloides nanus TaxID=290746 RepID=A0A914CKL8_9BILA